MKTTRKRLLTSLFLSAVLVLPASAQSTRGDLNTLLTDIGVPVFGFVMVFGIMGGLAKNWRLITDENSEGNKKQGVLNLLVIGGYTVLAATILSAAAMKLSALNIAI